MTDADITPAPTIAAILAVAGFYLGPRVKRATMAEAIDSAMVSLELKWNQKYHANPDAGLIFADAMHAAAPVGTLPTWERMNPKQRKAAMLALVDTLIPTLTHPAPAGRTNPEYMDTRALPAVAKAVGLGLDIRTAVDVALLDTLEAHNRAALYGDILAAVADVAAGWTAKTLDASRRKQVNDRAEQLKQARFTALIRSGEGMRRVFSR